MLSEPEPLEWWGDFIDGQITNAEFRAFLKITVFAFLGVPGLGSEDVPLKNVSFGKYVVVESRNPATTLSLRDPEAFRTWLAREHPEHLATFDAAIVARAMREQNNT